MIDCDEFDFNVRREAWKLVPKSEILEMHPNGEPRLDDNQYLLCYSHMPGCSLVTKKWGWFDVAKVKDVEYSENAFSDLVLPKERKEMIRSIVKVQTDNAMPFEDSIKGKGNGVIFLLHGPPGVGKTFTAGMLPGTLNVTRPLTLITESIAEYTHRPLYTINCGDLGYRSEDVETNLSAALALATRWNAVVLIDEADVFMAERTPNDVKRNALVAGKHPVHSACSAFPE